MVWGNKHHHNKPTHNIKRQLQKMKDVQRRIVASIHRYLEDQEDSKGVPNSGFASNSQLPQQKGHTMVVGNYL
jgi:hypothetical protein